MNVKKLLYSGFAVSAVITAGFVGLLYSGLDRQYYFDGMFRDDSIKESISPEDLEKFKTSNADHVKYKYLDGKMSYKVNGEHPDYLYIYAAQNCEDGKVVCAIQSAKVPIKTDNEAGDGFALRAIDGEVYSFSSGKFREDAAKYKDQIKQSITTSANLHEWLISQ